MPSNIEEIKAFVNSIYMASTEGREPMTQDDAYICIKEWKAEGIEIPEKLDAFLLAQLWNEMLNEEGTAPDKEDPAERHYLLKTWQDGILEVSVKTGKQIADIYEMDQICGIFSAIEVWDVEGDPKRISLLGLVCPILDQKRWMEQEYRDYCENEAYGDY